MSPAKRRRTRNLKAKPIIYPMAIERQYKKHVTSILEKTVTTSIEKLRPYLLKYTPSRFDSADTELDEIMRQIDEELLFTYGTTLITSGNMGRALEAVAEKLFGKNSAFMQKELILRTGVPIDIPNAWWPEAKGLWEQENYKLITSLNKEYVTKLNSIITSGVQNGTEFQDIVNQIENLGSQMTGYRAKMIARDQIGKLQSIISKNQALSLGMDTYYWITARDEKVRGNPAGIYPKAIPDHNMMDEGQLFSWKNSNIYSIDNGETWLSKSAKMVPVHPGMAIMCRCTAASTWGGVWDIDRQIGDNI